ncbi:MAG: proline--tRNA ligase [Dehalococcoidia bacterium]|nr:proline--tRNA ligase [Dehalococcoidia bacterium]
MATQQPAPTQEPAKITPRATDFAAWYQDVIAAAELAESAPVRGCIILRPNGYAIWEAIQRQLDDRFKSLGIRNAYFPVFIPESFIRREAEHVEGFSPELAVVTHAGGEQLEEPLVVRPTSETIIWASYKRWIRSHRDLPLLLNQWSNVVRWEKRPRAFLRTTEFLWQEGHTAHATPEEARAFARTMLGVYSDFADEVLALAPLPGEKPPHERFAGAVATFSIEPMMQDGRALQAGTSHDLGQNFARAFDVTYQTEEGDARLVSAASWGVSTRLVGGVVMAHGDDTGCVFPPLLAPVQVAIVPILGRNEASARTALDAAQTAEAALRDAGLRTAVDDRAGVRPGAKYFEWERRGAPLRLEIGPRDVAKGQAIAATRHDGQKRPVPLSGLATAAQALLDEVQAELRTRAHAFREQHTTTVEDREALTEAVAQGYALARWCENPGCAQEMQQDTRATVRCFPFERTNGELAPLPDDPGPCAWCGQPAARRVIVARAY